MYGLERLSVGVRFGEYFPGTGDVKDMGAGPGKNYSINFPLKDGIDDEMYQRDIYQPVMKKVLPKQHVCRILRGLICRSWKYTNHRQSYCSVVAILSQEIDWDASTSLSKVIYIYD